MMLMALAILAAAPSEFGVRMKDYIGCVGAGLPANMASLDQRTRTSLYRRAVGRCQRERTAAINAAIEGREPGASAASARAMAIDIIDTLDPMSNANPNQ